MASQSNAFTGYVPQINWAQTFKKQPNGQGLKQPPAWTGRDQNAPKMMAVPSGSINTEKTLARDKSAKLRGKL